VDGQSPQQVVQPEVRVTTYGYDEVGNRTTLTDPKQHTTTTDYNSTIGPSRSPTTPGTSAPPPTTSTG
jgi:YD repeat-containing protein